MTQSTARRAHGEYSISGAGLAGLRGDCARMAPHWTVPAEPRREPASPDRIAGVRVPAASARLIAGTAPFGD
ncbi:hypothetical protein ACN20G_19770 [Streptomyces sp. BI20]|uniref:hypothetical protein n=1 Tax=Streptomyces sp. BI20 TaxID=3403460 RepID=UPI003C7271E8